MFLRALFRQMSLGRRLTMIGSVLVVLGVVLFLAWLVTKLIPLAGAIVLAGVILLLIGSFLTRRERNRPHGLEDEIPYL